MLVNHQTIIETYRNSASAKDAAKKLGITYHQVYNILRKYHAGIGKGTRYKKDWNKIENLFLSGKTTREIADSLGIEISTVSRNLTKMGYRLHVGRTEWIILPINEIEAKYNSGMSAQEIGDEYGVSGNLIRKKMKKHNIARRSAKIAVPKGKKNYQYKHGRNVEGRQSPNYDHHRYIAREVVAVCLGKPHPYGWIVHHINEDQSDNRPENLALFPSPSHHAKYHQRVLRLQRAGVKVNTIQILKENGGQLLPPPPRPISFLPDTGLPDLSGSRAYRKKLQKKS